LRSRRDVEVDEEFLTACSPLSQEQNIKTGPFALIYADEAISAHERERYAAFVETARARLSRTESS